MSELSPGRRAAACVLLCAAAAVLTVASPAAASTRSAAKTIAGTAGSDVLRGTTGRDTIYGKAGNDTISGLGGSDLIVGGPGADRISCGPGLDTVIADAQDAIGSDCEIVKGVRPAKPHVLDGDYVGSTGQQNRFGFDVSANGTTISGFSFVVNLSCGSGAIRVFGWSVVVPGPATLGADGSFSVTISEPGHGGFTTSGTLGGVLDLSGNGRGTLSVELDDQENGIDCTTGPLDWTVQRSQTLIPVAHYVAETDQQRTVSFQTADGAAITDFTVGLVATCSDTRSRGFTFSGAAFTLKSRSFQTSETLKDGSVAAIKLDFDAAGFVSGTVSFQHIPATDAAGVLCDTGTIGFSGGP